jgi:hypothetical protein
MSSKLRVTNSDKSAGPLLFKIKGSIKSSFAVGLHLGSNIKHLYTNRLNSVDHR